METRLYKKGEVIKSFTVDNDKILATVQINGEWVSNPSVAAFEADGWERYTPPTPPPYVPTRSEQIHAEIRERYTNNDELMILRQYTADPTNAAYKVAFDEYNAYVESVLAKYPEENE